MKNHNIEVWKAVEGYENLYQVSNLGNVKSLDREVTYSSGVVTLHKGKTLKQDTARGYKRVTLSENGKTKRFQVHRLVAMHFVENPEDKPHVNHLDGNKANNVVDNLEWCTASENEQHSFKVLGKKALRGDRKKTNKLKEKDISEIRKMYNDGYLQREIAVIFNVSRRHISDVVNYKRWEWIE